MSDKRLLARAFESIRAQAAEVKGEPVAWDERVLVVYSPDYSHA